MFEQKLYYKNIPISKKRVANTLKFPYTAISEIANNKNPCFIWTGTGTIKFPSFYSKTINKLSKKTITIYLYEPQSFYTKRLNRHYFSEFSSDTDILKIKSTELDSISRFQKKYNLNIIVKTCEYNSKILELQYPKLQIECYDIFLREISNDPVGDVNIDKKEINKKFFCSNWRYALHRHFTTAYVSNFDSNFSWYYNCSIGTIKSNNFFNLDDIKNEVVKEKLITGFRNLNTPNTVFDKKGKVDIDNTDISFHPDGDAWHNDIPRENYTESFCAIINETRYFQPFPNISEKTLRAIDNRIPFIIVGPPYTLEYIKSLGFKTFNKWWEESYDQETDHQKRMYLILDLIEKIGNLSFNELQEIYQEMIPTLNYNRKVFLNLNKV